MVINMDETRLRTIEQLQAFLVATPQVGFTAHVAGAGDDNQRYEHISRVLARFDYPHRKKRERGVVLAYLRHTSGYGRAQMTRLVERWSANRAAQCPLVKLYRPPAAPFARKYSAARCGAVGGDGPRPRGCLRPGHRAPVAAGLWRVRR
jgi:hypothetical protein